MPCYFRNPGVSAYLDYFIHFVVAYMELSYEIFPVAISFVLVLRGVQPRSVSGVYYGEPIQHFILSVQSVSKS